MVPALKLVRTLRLVPPSKMISPSQSKLNPKFGPSQLWSQFLHPHTPTPPGKVPLKHIKLFQIKQNQNQTVQILQKLITKPRSSFNSDCKKANFFNTKIFQPNKIFQPKIFLTQINFSTQKILSSKHSLEKIICQPPNNFFDQKILSTKKLKDTNFFFSIQ